MSDKKHLHQHRGFLVLDYGSQYTLLIARRLREIGHYSEVVDGRLDAPPEHFDIEGVILSGGPDSVSESLARALPNWILQLEVPVLGICYGMQLLVTEFGGNVQACDKREYGRAQLQWEHLENPHAASLLNGITSNSVVWMSHGDSVESIGTQFELAARTLDQAPAIVCHKSKPIFGLQFHPEVDHSECGTQLLLNFTESICKANANWRPKDMLEICKESVLSGIHPDDKVLLAVSGGVDSTVAAVLLREVLHHDQLTCIFVDHGLLRYRESEEVVSYFKSLNIQIEVLDEREVFFSRLAGISDPEEKRKIIGTSFVDAFIEFGSKHAHEFSHLGQGTLYPDVIESAGHGAGSKVIKSHHNVGGLPEKLHLKLVEPFRYLFKDEVRAIGRQLGVPENILMRHPYPGPGLGVRIPGEVTPEKVEILQKADHIFIESLKEHRLYKDVWQAATILLPVRSVGIMGDNRTYQWTCVLRAVMASDGMTADIAELPYEFLKQVADRIVRSVDGINRVLYDVTSKPPATIEWE